MSSDEVSLPDEGATFDPVLLMRFAHELRRLAVEVERGLKKNIPIASLSAVTAMKPILGHMQDSLIAGVLDTSESSAQHDAPVPVAYVGYL